MERDRSDFNISHKSKSDYNVLDKVYLKSLPKFADLEAQVDEIVQKCSWWDLYGVDWAILSMFLALLPIALWLMRAESSIMICSGVLLLGWIHAGFAIKAGHISVHGGLTRNKAWKRPLAIIFVEFIGSFSEELSHDIHVKQHHPYTNIIGIGDSSTWKFPYLPRFVYMFLAPLVVPPLALGVSLVGLVQKKSILGLLRYIVLSGLGLASLASCLIKVSNFSLIGALVVIWVSRGIFSIPYIHVNIFQHIGLPMYSREHQPVRLYQMATGVLNLPRNVILDYAFGHAAISCHVEHHLFPRLSDNMCLKIKPTVSNFIRKSCLPYNEKTYLNRLSLFLDQYEKLMVNAPPITHFVGIQ